MAHLQMSSNAYAHSMGEGQGHDTVLRGGQGAEAAAVLPYTAAVLEKNVDVMGPLRSTLYSSSIALDTDFAARLSDVHPDGRATQLQGGMLRVQGRNVESEPQLLEPGHIHRLEIEMRATANFFRASHGVRLDISCADFARFDRNANRRRETRNQISVLPTTYDDAEYA